MSFLNFIYNKILLNQITLTFLSGIIGAIIGGWATYKLKKDELKTYEKATALSIVEELKVLLEEYQEEMDKAYLELDGNRYLVLQYSITQDFTTVYSQNAGELGLIKNEKLRKQIIKSYTSLKRYIEELLIYTNDYMEFEKYRNEFIGRAYPHSINTACSKANNAEEIAIIKDRIHHNDWSWLNTQFLNQKQVLVFVVSDNERIDYLIVQSEKLKKRFNKLKDLINETYVLACSIYGK